MHKKKCGSLTLVVSASDLGSIFLAGPVAAPIEINEIALNVLFPTGMMHRIIRQFVVFTGKWTGQWDESGRLFLAQYIHLTHSPRMMIGTAQHQVLSKLARYTGLEHVRAQGVLGGFSSSA